MGSGSWSREPEDLSSEPLLRSAPKVEFEGVDRPSVGRYVLLSKLGEGGMGVVYHATHETLGTEVAVKLLPRTTERLQQQLLARFRKEARYAAQLRTDHLVGVLDIAEDEATGSHFIVMEYVHGRSAEEWRRQQGNRPSEADALQICIGALRGLDAAHRQGVIHRDLKPSNIMIPDDEHGQPDLARSKLADLGLARDDSGDSELTATNLPMGTPGYMAPEQARSARRARKPADVCGMGATLYKLLVGQPPYMDPGTRDWMLWTLEGRYVEPRTARPDLSIATAALLRRCLAMDPDERYPDAAALLRAAELALQAVDVVVDEPETRALIGEIEELATISETGKRLPPVDPASPEPPVAGPSPKPTGPFEPRPAEPDAEASRRTRVEAPARSPGPPSSAPPSTKPDVFGAEPRLESDPPESPADGTPRAATAPPDRRPVWTWVAGTAALVTIVIVVLALLGRGPPPANMTAGGPFSMRWNRAEMNAALERGVDPDPEWDDDRLTFEGIDYRNRTGVHELWGPSVWVELTGEPEYSAFTPFIGPELQFLGRSVEETRAALVSLGWNADTAIGDPEIPREGYATLLIGEWQFDVPVAWEYVYLTFNDGRVTSLQVAFNPERPVPPDLGPPAESLPAIEGGPTPPDTDTGDAGAESARDLGPLPPILLDLTAWDASTSGERRSAAEVVDARLPQVSLSRLETFSAGDQTHEVAIFDHAKTGLEFVLIPVGTFRMGSPEDEKHRSDDERLRRVTLTRPFLIARTECTQAAWDRIGGTDERRWNGAGLPIESVSWIDVAAWCARAGLHLPTEAEWEYACRAGTTSPYSFGTDDAEIGNYAWFSVNARSRTHPVAGKSPNAFAMFDIHGNVSEWCQDVYDKSPSGPVTDPLSKAGSDDRVFRGGPWNVLAPSLRSAICLRNTPSSRFANLGFRPALSVPLD